MKVKLTKIEIRKNILSFFDANYIKCMDALFMAEDSNINNIYNNKLDFEDYIKLTNILVLTANTYETNILHQLIYKENDKKIIQCNYTFNKLHYEIYFFRWGQYDCVHIEAPSTGSNTVNGSEDMVRMMFGIKEFNPLAVLSFGICFGINYKTQCLGDIIISEKIYSYGLGIKVKDDNVEISDDNNYEIDVNLKSRIKRLNTLNIISENNREFLGNYITGEAVVSNQRFKQLIIKNVTSSHKRVLAGEMEGYGMFKECTKYGKTGNGSRPIPCVIIKSICDWGAEKNEFLNDIDSIDSTLSEIYKRIEKNISVYYNNKNRNNLSDTKSVIKNSLQAYAAQCAFNTCDKIFISPKNVFGVSPFNYICNIILDLKKKNDKGIAESEIANYLTDEYPFLKKNDINSIINDLEYHKFIYPIDKSNYYKFQ